MRSPVRLDCIAKRRDPGNEPGSRRVVGRVSGGNRLPPDRGISAQSLRSLGIPDKIASMSLSVSSPL